MDAAISAAAPLDNWRTSNASGSAAIAAAQGLISARHGQDQLNSQEISAPRSTPWIAYGTSIPIAAPSGPYAGMSRRFNPSAAPKAIVELIRFILGRSTMRIVSPRPTNAFSAHATPTMAVHGPPRRNAVPKIVMMAPPDNASTATAGSSRASIQRAR